MKRVIVIAGLLAVLMAACEPTRHPTTAAPTKTPSKPAASTGTRIVLPAGKGLELVALDSGRARLLVKESNVNGDYWTFVPGKNGIVAQGRNAGSGAGSIELNSWFIPNGMTPRPQRLGVSTDVVVDPTGSVWLADLPNNDAGFGSGTITLMTTSGRFVRRGTIRCCQRIEGAIGGGRFITTTAGQTTLRVYDALTKRFVRTLTPANSDAEFVRFEDDRLVWRDSKCTDRCTEHEVDVRTGTRSDHAARGDAVSPDGTHAAFEVGPSERTTISVDGRAVASSSDARRGIAWSPDGQWLFFVRPDLKHFGVWKLGTPRAQTVATPFAYLEEWMVFDQR